MTAMTAETAPRPTLEELVDRLIDAVFGDERSPTTSPARMIYEARRLRQAGDLDAALALSANLDLAGATDGEVRWADAEFLDLARRRFRAERAELYRAGAGRAAVLVPLDEATLEARAVLNMRWRPGQVVSRRSLRSLRPLSQGGSR